MSTAPAFPLGLYRSPFPEDQFTAVQFDKPRGLTGLQRLAFALIEDCFLAKRFALRNPHNVKGRKQCEKDLEWMDGADAPISFGDLCDRLGLDAATVRRQYAAISSGKKAFHKVSTFG